MQYSLYVDRIFFLHFGLQLLLLLLTARLGNFQTTWRRLLCGAAWGAAGFLLLLLPAGREWLVLRQAGYLLNGLAALQLAFRFRRREGLRNGTALYVSACCVLGGGLGGVNGLRRFFGSHRAKTGGGTGAGQGAASLWQVLLPALCAAALGLWVIHRQRRLQSLPLWQVTVRNRGIQLTMSALMDSGNGLYDPYTGAPVCIVERELAEQLGLLGDKAGIHMIPYHSIGKQHGLLMAAAADELLMEKGGQERKRKRVMLAVSPRKLSAGGHYRMLLHPALLEEEKGENHDIEGSSAGKDAV